MRRRHLDWIALAATLFLPTAAAARCMLEQLGVLPVTMHGLRPIATLKINGAKAPFLVDSGAFFSAMSWDAATKYHLKVRPSPGDDFYVGGAGGEARANIATVRNFTFLGATLHNKSFIVIDQNVWGRWTGSLGQNALRISDAEYDLANGIIRFIRPVGCKGQPLAYWAVNQPYSVVRLKYMTVLRSRPIADAEINGHRVTVLFDTGTEKSALSLQAAARIGITPESPGVTLLGTTGGVGPSSFREWLAPVASFQIGGEKVEHTHLIIGGHQGRTDMVLGEDFFLSNRIYFAYSQGKVYFTYNGGPLFNMDLPQFDKATLSNTADANAQASAPNATGPSSDSPTDAAGFMRQGMAAAAMRELPRALADLSRACGLAPKNAEYRYLRGVVYRQDKQHALALEDFDAAIKLRPDDVEAHAARANLLLTRYNAGRTSVKAEIESDLDTLSRLVRPASNVRLALATEYNKLGHYSTAIDQVDEWLSHHPLQGDKAEGLNARCWIRATADRDLHQALDDCNHALQMRPVVSAAGTGSYISTLASRDPAILDSRGLVYLRLGRLADAIDDYDSALKRDPKLPTSLYGRGLAELRKGEKAKGRVDLAAATKLDAGVAKRFAHMGLTP